MEKFFGTYEIDLSKDENIDAFVAKLGLPPPVVQAIKTVGVTRAFCDNADGKFFSEIIHPMRKTRYNFELNQQFDAEGFGGKQKTTVGTAENCRIDANADCFYLPRVGDMLSGNAQLRDEQIVQQQFIHKHRESNIQDN